MARYTESNDPCYRDSCVEVFLRPTPQSSCYVNLEMNCLGAILLQVHPEPRRGDSVDPARWDGLVERWTSVTAASLGAATDGSFPWSACLSIPVDLLHDLFSPLRLAAFPSGEWSVGLFKCADDSPAPHWASFAPQLGRLDFHQPDKFTRLALNGRRTRGSKRPRAAR